MTDIYYTPYDGNEGHDMTAVQVANNASKSIMAEAKVRLYPATYPSWMIEKKKWDYLMKFQHEYDKLLYINFFSNGSAIIWDLKLLPEPNWKVSAQEKDNFNTDNQVDKEEQDIWVSDAIQIIKPNKFDIYEAYNQAEEDWKTLQKKN